jgi:hypothetical protein
MHYSTTTSDSTARVPHRLTWGWHASHVAIRGTERWLLAKAVHLLRLLLRLRLLEHAICQEVKLSLRLCGSRGCCCWGWHCKHGTTAKQKPTAQHKVNLCYC